MLPCPEIQGLYKKHPINIQTPVRRGKQTKVKCHRRGVHAAVVDDDLVVVVVVFDIVCYWSCSCCSYIWSWLLLVVLVVVVVSPGKLQSFAGCVHASNASPTLEQKDTVLECSTNVFF